MKEKKIFCRVEQDECILSRVEKVRQKLHGMFSNNNGKLLDNEIIEMSQHLDNLIVRYMKNIGLDKNIRT
jgi:transcription initiation factor IIF auxiliary subunit